MFVFAPFLQTYLQPFIIEIFSNVPVLNSLFAGPPYGIGILTASLILAIMVVPFVASISRDVFDTVPPMLKNWPMELAARPGRSSGTSSFPTPGLGSSAASCWGSDARLAKRWQ